MWLAKAVSENTIDLVTNLFSQKSGRQYLLKRLNNKIKVNRRKGKEKNMSINQKLENVSSCLIFINANNLKNTNDNYGHEEGDFLLQSIADCLKKNFRAEDLIFRNGGDEFVVYADRLSAKMAEKCMQRVQKSIQEEVNLQKRKKGYPQSYGFSVSYGIADVDEILEGADIGSIDEKALMSAAVQLSDKYMYEYKAAFKKAVAEGIKIFDAFERATIAVKNLQTKFAEAKKIKQNDLK